MNFYYCLLTVSVEEDLGADIGATRVYSSGSLTKPGHTLVVKFNRLPAKKSWPLAKGF